jgi:hypothetical protein
LYQARAGSTWVTIGASHTAAISAITWRAVASCSGEVKKITERYWVPTSLPWRFRVVGSWMVKKISRMSR